MAAHMTVNGGGDAGDPGATDTSTAPEPDRGAGGRGFEAKDRAPPVVALVVIWCAEDPARVGEVLLVPVPAPGAAGAEATFGRGAGDEAGRVALARDRPGRLEPSPPLALGRLSRVQLGLRWEREQLVVRNVGKLPLFANGVAVSEAHVVPGDVLQLGQQLSFVCVRRPAWIPPMPAAGDYQLPAFGVPDAHGIVGESPAVWRVRRQIAFAAPRAGHALVVGATGVGKELVAQAIHAASPRAARALVSRSAATFPESLIDAELFGSARNYPQAGMPNRVGIIGQAAGSTLFLDEIGALPLALQTRLLRVLDGGEYQQLGDATVRRADFRLVAATNDAEALKLDLVARFTFRLDLPDLAARIEDVPLLVRHLLRASASQEQALAGGEPRAWQPSAGLVRRLVQHRYTTNVRELRAILWRCIQQAESEVVEWVDEPAPSPAVSGDRSPARAAVDPRTLDPAAIQACIDREHGVLERVWPQLGLRSRFALHRLIRKHGLVVKRDG